MSEKILLGFSPCPNDTFMFEALVSGRTEIQKEKIDLVIKDIEELNKKVIEGLLHVSKISFAVYPMIREKYRILNAGAALGYKNGPLVVSKHKIYPDELKDVKMAIPGFHTTANKLLEVIHPEVINKKEYLFSDIEEVVSDEEADAGLIIHESRFTYKKKGLLLVTDLGERWEKKFKLPVPLGGIVVRRDLPEETQQKIDRSLKASIEFAFENPAVSRSFIKNYSRELADDVIESHINLYVNDFSLDLGDKGKKAITFLLARGKESGSINPDSDKEYNDFHEMQEDMPEADNKKTKLKGFTRNQKKVNDDERGDLKDPGDQFEDIFLPKQ